MNNRSDDVARTPHADAWATSVASEARTEAPAPAPREPAPEPAVTGASADEWATSVAAASRTDEEIFWTPDGRRKAAPPRRTDRPDPAPGPTPRPEPPPNRSRSTRATRSTRTATRTTRPTNRAKRWTTVAIVVVLVALLVPIGVNYVDSLRAPGTDSTAARTVEWMREHGFGPMVNSIERWWYTNNKPPEGGTPEGGLPTAAAPTSAAVGRIPTDLALLVGSVKETLLPRTPVPPNMQPFVDTPLPNEGVWEPTGRTVVGTPALYTAFMRPDPIHTSLVAGFMWMDPKLLKGVHVPGLR